MPPLNPDAQPTSPRLLRDLYESGCSLAEIGVMISVSKDAVRHRLLLQGVKMRPRGGGYSGRLAHTELVKTAFLYEYMKWSAGEIAEHLGLSLSTVQYRLMQHGVQMRTKEESVKLRWARRGRRPPTRKQVAA